MHRCIGRMWDRAATGIPSLTTFNSHGFAKCSTISDGKATYSGGARGTLRRGSTNYTVQTGERGYLEMKLWDDEFRQEMDSELKRGIMEEIPEKISEMYVGEAVLSSPSR